MLCFCKVATSTGKESGSVLAKSHSLVDEQILHKLRCLKHYNSSNFWEISHDIHPTINDRFSSINPHSAALFAPSLRSNSSICRCCVSKPSAKRRATPRVSPSISMLKSRLACHAGCPVAPVLSKRSCLKLCQNSKMLMFLKLIFKNFVQQRTSVTCFASRDWIMCI